MVMVRPSATAILHNLGAHKVAGVREAIEAAGERLLYLPPYSPDFNQVEQTFAKLRALLLTAAARTIAANADRDDDASAGERQIRQGTGVLAVHPRRDAITPRTPGRGGFWPSGDGQARSHLDVIDKAGRDDRTEMKAAGHGRISDGKSRDP